VDGSLQTQDAVEGLTEAQAEHTEHALDFESFVLANSDRLYQALCLLTHDRYEAEDIEQEAFLRVLERWDRVSPLGDPVGYLYRTAMNVFRNRYRHARLVVRRAIALAPREPAVEAVEDHELVVQALATLPTDQRAALVMTSLLGFSSEEAGEILRAKPSAVRARATRARTALRQRIGDER
jgi:RNA polymerase sigma factor (sigma-70 family)